MSAPLRWSLWIAGAGTWLFLAAAMIVLFAGGSAWLVDSGVLRSAILAAGAIGIAYITLRVPSKERVLAERAA